MNTLKSITAIFFPIFLLILILNCGGKETKKPLEFKLETIDGQKITIKDYRNKIVLLDFWATWCPPCRAAIPYLIKLHEKYQDAGFVILGIGLDEADNLKKMAEEMKIPYPIIKSLPELTQFYKVEAIPTLILLDKDGKIYYREVGFSEAAIDTLENKIKKLLE